MNIVLLLLAGIILYESKLYFLNNKFNTNYLSKEDTTSIKGIFVLLVFLSHSRQYIIYSGMEDKLYLIIQNYLGQLIVAMFFFYSGYGIYEQIKAKGQKYINGIPFKRILKTLIHFDIIIIFYFIINIILGIKYGGFDILKSLIGWSSIGNSNWFIFAILVFYLTTFLSFKLFKNKKYAVATNILLIILYMFIIKIYKDSWWWDTAIAYPAGMMFSYYKSRIEKVALKNNFSYIFIFILLLISFVISYKVKNVLGLELSSILFCLLIVMITLKLHICNKIIYWIGTNVFGIYILQRVPMIIIDKYFVLNKYLFLILSFAITIILTILFNKFFKKIDNMLYRKA